MTYEDKASYGSSPPCSDAAHRCAADVVLLRRYTFMHMLNHYIYAHASSYAYSSSAPTSTHRYISTHCNTLQTHTATHFHKQFDAKCMQASQRCTNESDTYAKRHPYVWLETHLCERRPMKALQRSTNESDEPVGKVRLLKMAVMAACKAQS